MKVIVLTRALLYLVHRVRIVVQGIMYVVRGVIWTAIVNASGIEREIDAMIAIGAELNRVENTEIHHFVR